jgi:SSS family solute:Na+ symporter
MGLHTIDLVIVVGYALTLIALATFLSREKAGHQKDSEDYFLAGKTLPWWAVGASLIAANISAEQIIGMSGSGYVVGLAVASYEWMAAATLLIVGKFFLPVFLKRGIITMPQFLEQRYNGAVKTLMAVFWLILYTFVNLTAILWLGATAMNTLGGFDVSACLVALAVFAVAYSLYGGLKAVALTDIIQVVLLVAGGILITWLALDALSDGAGPLAGMTEVLARAPEKFDMILAPGHPEYMNYPGLAVLIGGMWMMNVSYWGFNQYIIQRALGAKSVDEAQKGIVFAAFLKLLMPLIVVIPGIAAFLLVQDGVLTVNAPDQAYPSLLSLAPVGAKGLIFAGLLAAIVSSLGSMMNSISTIFTLDVFKPLNPSANERTLVTVGRIVSFIAIAIATAIAQPLLGQFDQAFQFIQNFTGFFTPGIVAIFVLGIFWRGATAGGALLAALVSVLGSAWLWWMGEGNTPAALGGVFETFGVAVTDGRLMLPFMDRVFYVFVACCVIMLVMGLLSRKPQPGSVDLQGISFRTSVGYNIGSAIVVATLVALYAAFW